MLQFNSTREEMEPWCKGLFSRYHILLTMMTVFSLCTSSEICKPFNINPDYFNKRLTGHSFYTSTLDLHDCARYCIYMVACMSFNFDLSTDTCELNDIETRTANVTEIEAHHRGIVSDISEWPREMGGSCSSKPCSAHQLCIPTSQHQCMDIDCGRAPAVANGIVQHVTPNQYFLLDTASVTCLDGFVANQSHIKCKAPPNLKIATCVHSGNDGLACTIKGQWETPACTPDVPPTTTAPPPTTTIGCTISPGAYMGSLSSTNSGKTCQRWDSQSPHGHTYTSDGLYPEGDISLAENYCRALGETYLWCYTTDSSTRWEACIKPFEVC